MRIRIIIRNWFKKGSSPKPYPHTFENDSEGLKVLAEGQNPVVDIIAVHGLNEHRERSYTAENGMSWLRDFLPATIPNARIMTYGYDADTSPKGNKRIFSVGTHGHELTQVIDRAQRTAKRPIIFIGHGMGCMVIRETLLQICADDRYDIRTCKNVLKASYGVVFIEDPQRGSAKVGKSICRMLSTDEQDLAQQYESWLPLAEYLKVVVFYKSSENTSVGTGKKAARKPPGAQTIGTEPRVAKVPSIALRAGKTGIAVFESPQNVSYQALSRELRSMVGQVPYNLGSNWGTALKVARPTQTRVQHGIQGTDGEWR